MSPLSDKSAASFAANVKSKFPHYSEKKETISVADRKIGFYIFKNTNIIFVFVICSFAYNFRKLFLQMFKVL